MITSTLFEGEWLSEIFKIIFPVLIVIGISTIILYLLKLVIVAIRLFQAFWASLEDED
jgi:tellurite resistance protein TehA-like permease